MTRLPAAFTRRVAPLVGTGEVLGLAIVAYIPFLASSRGLVSSDTKQYLYLDPARLLARAPYMWDPHIAAGTVPHQNIGYLFPMGPWFWVFDRIGAPDWVAQRLWLGSITFAAALGARWLFTMLGTRRAGALAGALVYALAPYQLAFTARISVLLLPWAGLPWLIGLTMRAVRRGGWRDPALFALIMLTIGGVNASALLLVGIGPALWMIFEICRGRAAARAAVAAAARIGALTLGVSLWWVIGLSVQGAFGLPVLQLTENLQTVSRVSEPTDVLRGLGNWFLYGQDRFGYSIAQASSYAADHPVVFFSYAIPVVGLAAAVVMRWRYRAYFVLLVVIGTVVGVGAWPYADPTPYGGVWKNFANHSSLGLALRNAPRVGPVIVLGFAGVLAAAVGSLTRRVLEQGAAVCVAALAFVALWPVWSMGYLSPGVARPERIPTYWTEAAAAMQRDGNSTRVLEIPGAPFSAYRWGNTVEPVTPGLIDRPYLAREVLPYGAPQTVNLLDALDRRMQEGTFEPSSLAAVGRLLGIGTISLRSDLQYERFLTPRPRLLYAQLTSPLAPGLRPPTGFGPTSRNTPFPAFPLVDELDLRTPLAAPDPPPVALFEVKNSVPIVHTAPVTRPVVLDGDGDGLVEAAGAGLLDGRALVRELGAMDDGQLGQALQAGGDLVMTDSNRRRIQEWFTSLRDNKGPTERAGQTSPDKSGYDFRLDPFPGENDDGRTVVEQDGGRVDASADGGPGRPEDRPVRAFDGDLRTSWRVGGADPTGQRLVLRADRAVRTDRVTVVQPQDGPRDRVLTKVRLRFDNGAPITADLGPASLTPKGQVIRFPGRPVRRLEIDLLATSKPSFDPKFANAVGFAEVHLGNLRVTERVRLPVDLVQRVSGAARGHGLDVVLSRLRYESSDAGRQDNELALERRLVLPDSRAFELSGTARVNPNASDRVLDSVLGTTGPNTVFSASSHLVGDLGARASRAFDADPATAWSPRIGAQAGQWLDVRLPRRVTVDHLELSVLADGRHSVPTRLRLVADDGSARSLTVPPIADTVGSGEPHSVVVRFAPLSGRHVRLVVEAVRRETPIAGDARASQELPVGIIEAGLAGVPRPAAPANVPSRCRNDLLRVDGHGVEVRLAGSEGNARRGLRLSACAGPLAMSAGSRRLASRPGLDTGIDVDRVVLSSGRDGRPAALSARGAGLDTAGASTRVTKADATSARLSVRTDGKPFWLVFGQSHSTGWKASTAKGSVGPLQVVDGYANGWLVRPSASGTMTVNVDWTPQRLVWVGLGASVVAVLGCVGIVLMTSLGLRRRASSTGADALMADRPEFVSPLAYPDGRPPSWAMTAAVALVTTLGTIAVSRPWIGLLAGAATLLASRISRARALTLAIPLVLAFSRLGPTPELGWLALALLVVDLACGWLRARALDGPSSSPSG